MVLLEIINKGVITMDHIYSNTIEDARFIRSQFENLGTKMYYSTHPDSSWERGQNESR